jgi:hypothetical protein
MKRLTLRNIGPIKEADLRFGDLTVLVGPQATGKSISLQWLKLLNDTGLIQHQITKLTWLATWMRTTPLIAYPRQLVWIASGKSAFNSRHPSVRALASRGLRFVGSHLTL